MAHFLGVCFRLFLTPWSLLLPAAILIVALVVYQSERSEERDLKRTWEVGLKMKIESLQQVIGSRSGENSAKAAENRFHQPVFANEMRELEGATTALQSGPHSYGSPVASRLDRIEEAKDTAIGWMILACVLTFFSVIGLSINARRNTP